MPSVRKPPEPHNPQWAAAFIAARATLAKILRGDAIAIHHIGSTAIPDILAKPVIDILIEASSLDAIDRRNAALAEAGFVAKGENGLEGRRYFSKDDEEGVRSHHVHAFQTGSYHVERHLAFRDFLRARPDAARAYSKVKRSILNDWRGVDDYIARKASFVSSCEREALQWARGGREKAQAKT